MWIALRYRHIPPEISDNNALLKGEMIIECLKYHTFLFQRDSHVAIYQNQQV